MLGNFAEANRGPRRLILAPHVSINDFECVGPHLHQLGGRLKGFRA
jgi:hypothetical protein